MHWSEQSALRKSPSTAGGAVWLLRAIVCLSGPAIPRVNSTQGITALSGSERRLPSVDGAAFGVGQVKPCRRRKVSVLACDANAQCRTAHTHGCHPPHRRKIFRSAASEEARQMPGGSKRLQDLVVVIAIAQRICWTKRREKRHPIYHLGVSSSWLVDGGPFLAQLLPPLARVSLLLTPCRFTPRDQGLRPNPRPRTDGDQVLVPEGQTSIWPRSA